MWNFAAAYSVSSRTSSLRNMLISLSLHLTIKRVSILAFIKSSMSSEISRLYTLIRNRRSTWLLLNLSSRTTTKAKLSLSSAKLTTSTPRVPWKNSSKTPDLTTCSSISQTRSRREATRFQKIEEPTRSLQARSSKSRSWTSSTQRSTISAASPTTSWHSAINKKSRMLKKLKSWPSKEI